MSTDCILELKLRYRCFLLKQARDSTVVAKQRKLKMALTARSLGAIFSPK